MPFLVGYITPQDYGAVGDGVNDDAPAFQAAVVAINALGGGTLFIPPYYSYKLGSTVSLGPNITVSAYGAYMFAGNPTTPLMDNYLNQTAPTLYNGNSNITIMGGVWDEKAQVYNTTSADTFFFGHASNITCRDMNIRNTQNFHGIEYNAIQHGFILNCRFEGYNTVGGADPGEAIQIDVAIAGAGQPANDGTECADITIDGCYAGPAVDGSGLGAPGALAGAHSAQGGNSYQGIRIFNSVADQCTKYGIHAYNWAKCEIVGNTVISTGDSGIVVDTQNTGAYQPDSITVVGNTVTASTNYGIYINGNGAFTNNNVLGITVTGNTVRNITAGTGKAGINATFAVNATIADNVITGCTTAGIVCNSDTVVTIEGNTVVSCATGVSIGGCTQVQISNNNLQTGTSNGIFLGQDPNNLANTSDVNITGNSIENFTNAQVRGGTSATDVMVSNNKLTQGANGTFGVELVSTNTGWFVTDNWLDGTWTLTNALNTFNSTTKVTTTSDGKYGTRGTNWWGAQLDPRLTTATVANTVSETVIGTFTIPANDAQSNGSYRATIFGVASTTGTPTLGFNVRLGGLAGQLLGSFTAVTTTSNLVNGAWFHEIFLYCIANGASATWSAAISQWHQLSGTGTSAHRLTNGTVTVNSTTAQTLVVTAIWSAASASNTASSTAGLLTREF